MDKHSKKQIILAFIGNLAVAILKFMVSAISGSAAMFSEGLHSIADTSNQLFLLFGLNRSQKPANHEHQFGFGKERFFWSLIAAFGILLVGSALSIQKGYHAIVGGEKIISITWPLVVIFISLIIESYVLFLTYLLLNKKRGKNSLFKYLDDSSETALITVFFEDTAAVASLFVAAAGITLSYIFHTSLFDGIASILIGILLGAVAIFLVNKNKELLTDMSDRAINKKVREIFLSHPAVERFHDLRTIVFGPSHVIVVADVEFKEEFIYRNMEIPNHDDRMEYTEQVIKQIGHLTDQLESEIRTACPEVKEIYLEVEQDKNAHRKIKKKIRKKVKL